MPAALNIPSDQVLVWQSWYANMASLKDIANRSGISRTAVRALLLKHGTSFDRGAHISAKSKGRISPRRGAKLPESSRAAISIRMKGNKFSVGRVVSAETKEKIRLSQIGKSRLGEGIAAAREAQRQKFKRVLKSLLRAAKIKKRCKTADAVGFTREVLIAHIEAQFRPEMSWADRSSFSIDHKVPVAEFIRRGITDPKIVCSLANLQPLPPKENRVKRDKYEGNFHDDLKAIIAFNGGTA